MTPVANTADIRSYANLIWGIAELLRGDYKQADYGKVILPLVVMRRLDQALEPTKAAVVAKAEEAESWSEQAREQMLARVAGQQFFNRSSLSFPQLLDDPGNIAIHLHRYVDGYSALARQAIDHFDFEAHIDRLDRSNLLYQVVARVCEVDLSPARVSNLEMGYLFEELIRRFAEQSNETAGEHFTPREVVRLMVNLLLDGDDNALSERGAIRTIFDPACGTGGMLSEGESQIRAMNDEAEVYLYGQELNPESYAICLADMLVKDKRAEYIVFGNALSADGHAGERFHYGIANPPFGVDWSKVAGEVRDEHARLGFDGRFGAGLPRKSDGQLLFLLHLISKMRDLEQGGGRIAIVQNGSPLFTGAAGSGESEIRRWIIENDWLEAIVALPEQLFYNTGIATYVWLVTNRKTPERAGKVQLIDARDLWVKMRKSLGEKRREISAEQIAEITQLHGAFQEGERVKILRNEEFGYRTVTVERPLRGNWEVGPDTWEGLGEDRALGKLDESSERPAVVAALDVFPQERFEGEPDARERLKAALTEVIPKVPAPLLRALVARTLVRDPEAPIVRDAKGEPVFDPALRDTENIPLTESVDEHFDREVLPHVPDAVVPDPVGKIGYEIPFTRLFYKYTPPAAVGGDQGGAAGAGGGDPAAAGGGAGLSLYATVPIKRVARLVGGSTPNSNPEHWGGEVLWYTPPDISRRHGGYVEDSARTITASGLASCSATLSPPGSVIVTTRAPIGNVAISRVASSSNQGCRAIVPDPGLDPRFLRYQLQTRGEELQSIGQGATFLEISGRALGEMPIAVADVTRQARVVEFLDRECERLAALNAALMAFETRVLAERDAENKERLASLRAPETRLHTLVDPKRPVMYGIVLPGEPVDQGVLLVKGGNVEREQFEPHQLVRVAPEIEDPYRRARLRGGDLLVSIRGGFGAVAQVPAELSGANITQDTARVAPGGNVDSRYLLHALRAPTVQARMRARATGASIRGINIRDLKRVRIPTPSLEAQHQLALAFDSAQEHRAQLRARARSLTLRLAEYRDALITEAVTGQLDAIRVTDSQMDERLQAATEGRLAEAS